MRFLARLLILMSLFAVNFASIHAIAQESDAPFIYYYSPDDRAIVIERADGSDRHTIRNPQLPPNHDFLFDLQWSPSGEWLAWLSA